MSRTIASKLHRKINDSFRDHLYNYAHREFGIEIETKFSLMSMRVISTRKDGKPFTKKQHSHLQAFECGYLAAMEQVSWR